MVSISDCRVLSRFFTPSFIDKLVTDGESASFFTKHLLSKIAHKIKFDNISNVVAKSYKVLFNNYPIEYIYKNEIIEQIFKKHDIETSVAIMEFAILRSKLDVLLLNGNFHAYEIKTELDTLDRLDKQLEDYQNVCEKITVVVSENKLKRIQDILPSHIGISVFSNKQIYQEREAQSNIDNIKLECLFNTITSKEIHFIIEKYYQEKISVENWFFRDTAKPLYCSIPKTEALKFTIEAMKVHRDKKHFKDFIADTHLQPMLTLLLKKKLSKQQVNTLLFNINATNYI